MIQRHGILEDEVFRLVRENYSLRDQKLTAEQIKLIVAEQLTDLQASVYGASSERYKNLKIRRKKTPQFQKNLGVKRPSDRYPNIPVRVEIISMDSAPNCDACDKVMSDSGMTEDSEQLTVIPKKYEILQSKRVIYRCSCHSCLITTPAPPRIIEGSSYSDEMILDVVLSKYCDLIPIERYAAMANRGGLMDLPPQSLIGLTHAFANFVRSVYDLIKAEAMKSRSSCR
ncbi:MAG: hypothetical protein IPK68_02260 [Bdellovibrionales bacterium]|nr:hypothetical protein [Bdellovibrionales bacterium]